MTAAINGFTSAVQTSLAAARSIGVPPVTTREPGQAGVRWTAVAGRRASAHGA